MSAAQQQREVMECDVVIVGAGPAGLSAAIRLMQLAKQTGEELSVIVLEKGSEVGAHILSGAVFDPIALNELLPDWKQLGAPLHTPVTKDSFVWLGDGKRFKFPVPPSLKNHGNYVISLGNLTRWLAKQAEGLGVQIFAGFAAADVIIEEEAVRGIVTGEFGVNFDGDQKSTYQPAMEIRAKQTLFAEGCRGSLSQKLMARFGLREGVQPQTYGLGIKEIWEIDPAKHKAGSVMHSIGWPLDVETYGGGFLYHLENNQVAVGFIVGLDYKNPYLDPFKEFQKFKTHFTIRKLFEGGRRVAYGARALNEGGWQSIPKLTMRGGALIGCAAGFLNVARIKGSHTAMKSGMLAAEATFAAIASHALEKSTVPIEIVAYPEAVKASWIETELYACRNIRPAFARWGLIGGIAYAALETYVFKGRFKKTFSHHEDHKQLEPADYFNPPVYPAVDGKLVFDKLDSLSLSGVNHTEDQPVHLKLRDRTVPITLNLEQYDAPEQRYCPAGVYEIIGQEGGHRQLVINAQNCIHCKTCDIKDPTQNITWIPPEGGGGPNYPNM